MKKLDYNALIQKSLTGQTTPQEDNCLRQWLNLDKEHQREWEEIKSIWRESEEGDDAISDEQFNNGLIKLERNVTESIKKERNLRRLRYGVLVLAVINVTLFSFSLFFFIPPAVHTKLPTFSKVSMINRKVILPDSSTISMNDRSEFATTYTDTLRTIFLKGEAIFDVRKEARPFQLEIPGFVIHVIGTSFHVHAYQEEQVDMVVERGVIEVVKGNRKWRVSKGEHFFFNKDSGARVVQNTELNFNSWFTHKLKFDKTELSLVIAEVEKHYNIKCKLRKEIAKCRFTGTFDNISLSDVIRILSYSMDIEFTLTKEGIYEITGRGCEH